MRSDGVLKVILNARIQPSMPLHVRNEKYLEFYAPESEKMTKFLCKCKNGEVARRFESVVRGCVPVGKRKGSDDDGSDSNGNGDKRVKLQSVKVDVKSDAKTDVKAKADTTKSDDKPKTIKSDTISTTKLTDKPQQKAQEKAEVKPKVDLKEQPKPTQQPAQPKQSQGKSELLVTPEKK